MDDAKRPNPGLLVLAALAIAAIGLGIAAAVGAFSSGGARSAVGGSVAADVDGHPVTVERARRQMLAYVRLSLGSEASVPVPPEYTACIAVQRKRAPGNTKPKEACAQLYASVKASVLESLVRATWLELIAAQEGISVTDREVEGAFKKSLETNGLKTTAQLNAYIADQKSHGALPEVLARFRQTLLQNKLRLHVEARVPPVTEAEARAYYDSEPNEAESFDFLVVRSRTGANPAKIKQQLANGTPWATVVKSEGEAGDDYGEEPHEDEETGEVKEATPSELTPELAAALKAANVGELVGPIPSNRGVYRAYIFKITKVKRRPRPSFSAEKSKRVATLLRKRQEAAFASFTKNSEAHYRALTSCSREWVDAAVCGQGRS
jgi:parvulin-like peptidyl-prolyl isomerase